MGMVAVAMTVQRSDVVWPVMAWQIAASLFISACTSLDLLSSVSPLSDCKCNDILPKAPLYFEKTNWGLGFK